MAAIPEAETPYMQARKTFWQQEGGLTLQPGALEVLVNYSGIPRDQVMTHITDIAKRAYAIYPYPCIGWGRFLDMAAGEHALYASEILPRLKSTPANPSESKQTYLDLGCAFAQDLRRMAYDGVDSTQLYACDLRLEFLDLGYELFRDKERLKSTFMEADVFNNHSVLTQLDGKIDIIGANSFFHLFDLPQQKEVGRRIIKLLKPRKDSLIIGRQVGTYKPGNKKGFTSNAMRYRHSDATWRQMWDELGAELGLQFETNAQLVDLWTGMMTGQEATLGDSDAAGLLFSVRVL